DTLLYYYGTYGMYWGGFQRGVTITKNKFWKYRFNGSASPTLYGIYMGPSPAIGQFLVANNLFGWEHDTSTNYLAIYGMYMVGTGGPYNIYNNTFYIGGSAANSYGPGYVIYHSSGDGNL